MDVSTHTHKLQLTRHSSSKRIKFALIVPDILFEQIKFNLIALILKHPVSYGYTTPYLLLKQGKIVPKQSKSLVVAII